MDFDRELSVKGFCFRGFPENRIVAQMVKACGLDRIDLSGVQMDFRKPEQHDPVARIYEEAGVKIVGIGATPLMGLDADEELFRFCRRAGCSTISISGEPETFFEALKRMEAWAEAYDMRLAIHNHGGRHWLGSGQMLKYILSRSGPRVGLCIDTAWCLQAGENPLEWLDRFAGRVYAVHFKDFRFTPQGAFSDVIVGEGGLDLAGFVRKLRDADFNGPAVVEYEADVENPVPALSACVRRMREVIRGL